jgi:hypothetical protein
MANKDAKIIEPVYREWWEKGPIVAATGQHVKDIKLGFYAGVYVAMGLIARANKLDEDLAINMARQMVDECRAEIIPAKIKFTPTINGQPIDN